MILALFHSNKTTLIVLVDHLVKDETHYYFICMHNVYYDTGIDKLFQLKDPHENIMIALKVRLCSSFFLFPPGTWAEVVTNQIK